MLDVSTLAEELDSSVNKESHYATDGKTIHILYIRSDAFYHVFAYTFVDHDVEVGNDENYNEDIQLLSVHFKTMFYK